MKMLHLANQLIMEADYFQEKEQQKVNILKMELALNVEFSSGNVFGSESSSQTVYKSCIWKK